jgi:hypothetical protein
VSFLECRALHDIVQGGEEVYTVRMKLAGQLGAFDVHICDAGGEGGASLLETDDLHLQLVAGAKGAPSF